MVPLQKKRYRSHRIYSKTFQRCIIGLKDYDYEKRLSILKLPSLEFRRIRGDLIETFKILNKIYDPITTNDLVTPLQSESSCTRSNSFKIYKKRFNLNTYKYFFQTELSIYGTTCHLTLCPSIT